MARAATQKDKDSFVDAFTDYALDVAKATGLAPQVVLGQSALETGWGLAVAGNNMFGVKGKGVTVTTHEDYGKGLKKEQASFRAYDDKAKSFRDYSSLMDRLYGDVTKAPTVSAQIAALHASPYATDTKYDKKLSNVVDQIEAHRTFQDKVVNATAALDPAEVNFDGVPFNDNRFDDNSIQIDPVNFGTVENLGALPDLSVSPSYDGFDIPASAGFSLPDMATPNFDDVSVGSYPDITAGTAFDPMSSFSPVDAAPVNLSDVDVGSFPDITAQAYDPASWSADFNPAPADFSDVPTPSVSGFRSGVDGWSAPETFGPDQHDQMAAEIANTKEQQGIARATNHATMSISPDIDALNDSLMAEIGVPQAPAATTQTAWGPTPAAAVPSASAIPQGDIEAPSTVAPRASAPAPVSSFTERASAPRETAPHDQFGGFGPTLSASEYANQVGSTFGTGKPQGGFMDAMANPTMANNYGSLPEAPAPSFSNGFGLGGLFGKSTPDQGFMDAMASPQHAAGYSPGIMGGWTGGALKGAAFGALTGGPFGALVGAGMGALNLDGRLGAAFSNQFGNFTGFDGFDGYDYGTMNYGAGYNDRGERSHSGVDNSGNASVGDGSFGSQSGVNDNNPQGIL